jgi:hypothetical protein
MTLIYIACVLKSYNTDNGIVLFRVKITFPCCKNAYYNAGVVAVNFSRTFIGLDPDVSFEANSWVCEEMQTLAALHLQR